MEEKQIDGFQDENPALDNEDSTQDQLADAVARISQLEDMVAQLNSKFGRSNPLPPVLIGEQTSSAGQWRELIISGGSLTAMGTVGVDGRGCNNATGNAYALPYALSDGQFLVVESQDALNSNYLFIPGTGIFKVYLTQNGGSNGTSTTDCTYTYDCYSDVAKTIKVASTQAPDWRYLSKCAVTAATKGQGYFNGSTFVLQIAYEALTSNDCS